MKVTDDGHYVTIELEDPADPESRIFEIEHPEGCPEEVLHQHPDDPTQNVTHHTCGFDWEVEHVGADAFEGMPLGRHRIAFVVEGLDYFGETETYIMAVTP